MSTIFQLKRTANRHARYAGSGDPYLSTDRVLFDTRAGKANDIQALASGTSLSTALSTALASTSESSVQRFLTNFDGSGTRAFAADHVGFATMALTQAITGSGSPQTVTVNFGQAYVAINKVVGIGWQTANVEAVTVTAVSGSGTGTITGVFTKNHSNGDLVADGQDFGQRVYYNLSGSPAFPRHLFVQWKQYMGRTATDSSGLGGVGSYVLYNGNIGNVGSDGQGFSVAGGIGNAGRKLALITRPMWDGGGCDRINILWPGSGGSGGSLYLDSDAHYNNENTYATIDGSYDTLNFIGVVVTHTLEFLPESSLNAGDGSLAITAAVSGGSTYVGSGTSIYTGVEPCEYLDILATFNSPQQPQTEYIWDIVGWERPWVGQVPPPQPSAIPTFVSSTSTTMTFTLPIPTPAPDAVRFFAGGTGPGASTMYWVGGSASGGSQIGSDLTLVSGDAGTTKTLVLTGLTASHTYTGICASFIAGGKVGVQSGGLASESTS